MTFQRTIQIVSRMLFFLLLAGAAFRFAGWLPHDLFLGLDPAAAFLTGISPRIWLAGERDRKCLLCDEVCPYDAIVLKRVPEVKVPVPFVIENRCSGCGFCEHHCPVEALPAIVVEPMEALRLAHGSYRQKGRSIGLALELGRQGPRMENGQTPLPMNEGDTGSGLPPGFSE